MDDIKAHNYFENFMLPFAVILWHGDSQEEHPIYTQGECDHERHKHKAVWCYTLGYIGSGSTKPIDPKVIMTEADDGGL